MGKSHGIILTLAVVTIIIAAAVPCLATEKDKQDAGQPNIWTEGESREAGRGSRWYELTDEEIGRVLEELKKRDPKRAKELTKLREKDPEKFRAELREHAREEYGKVVKERIEKWREQRRVDFLEWLGKNVPKEAEELTELEKKNADLYSKKYELARRKYGHIYDESRRSPELAEVLLEDLQLQKRRDEIVKKIKAVKSDEQRQKLTAQLEEVVALRYDLIVRRKQITYERLLKWLDELQERVKKSRAEIADAQKKEIKEKNVKERTKQLLDGEKGFRWD
ncbi:MAG: hypothetical protein ABIF19_01260 [Planctomycetota bacterium]